MTLNRTSEALLHAAALAVIGALCGRLASPSSVGQPESVPRPSPAVPTAAAPEPAVAAPGPAPLPTPVAVNRADDANCTAKPLPPPMVAAADGEPEASEVATRPAVAPDPARVQILSRMKSSTDPYANAVAVWLDVVDEPDPDAGRIAERTRRLAAMAASTLDPRIYTLALRTCWGRATQPCEGLSARRWAQIEPDNAMPWLMLMDESARHDDVSGLQEAMFHITQARHLSERDHAPLQPIIDAASDDPASLLAARALAIDAIGISAAQVGTRGYSACRFVPPSNANVWQQCVAMADLLEHRSDSLRARMTGASIDQQLTGNTKPREQIAIRVNRMATLDLASSSGCGDLRSKLALMRRMAVEGEVAATFDAWR